MIPPLRFTEVSAASAPMPKALATALLLCAVSTSRGTSSPVCSSATNWVLTLLNHTWWREGARKPLLAVQRRASASLSFRRTATLPVEVFPKSL